MLGGQVCEDATTALSLGCCLLLVQGGHASVCVMWRGGSLVCSWTSSTTSQTSNISGFHVSVDISNLCVLILSEGTAGEGSGGEGGQRHSPVL